MVVETEDTCFYRELKEAERASWYFVSARSMGTTGSKCLHCSVHIYSETRKTEQHWSTGPLSLECSITNTLDPSGLVKLDWPHLFLDGVHPLISTWVLLVIPGVLGRMKNIRLSLGISYSTHGYFKPFVQTTWFHFDGPQNLATGNYCVSCSSCPKTASLKSSKLWRTVYHSPSLLSV